MHQESRGIKRSKDQKREEGILCPNDALLSHSTLLSLSQSEFFSHQKVTFAD